MGRNNFTLKSACGYFSKFSREALLMRITQKLLDDVKLDMRYTRCSYQRVKFPTVTWPADLKFSNAPSDPLVQYIIYLIIRQAGYAYGCYFLLIKLAIYMRAVSILQFVDCLWASIDYFDDPKYICTKIVLGRFGKLHLLFADRHMKPDAELGRHDANSLPLGLHPTPYGEQFRFGHSRTLHHCSRVYRVIVGLAKFRRNVCISVGICICKLLVVSIAVHSTSMFHDGTFHVWIFAHLNQGALRA